MDEHAASFNSAAFDALTGLPNRALFDDRLSQVIAMSNRSGRRFAIHMCDLDGFRSVAQRAGTAGADAALKTIAGRFVAALRESDTVARFGWDEFVALQPELEDEEDARDMAERLRRAVYAPVVVESDNYQVGVSIGIALFPLDGETGPSLLEAAERALRRAKAQARGGVVFAQDNAASSA
ncbi:MAG TPA: GGDEF domain-containing protein [Candidatus Acidoferrales bacterium]|nr:GGDEF domain-containing protein [Candidatus Acidoferrales bacterium]